MQKETLDRLAKRLARGLKYDTARIVRPLGRMFLVVGKRLNTKSRWVDEHGNEKHFDCLDEHTIASGANVEELTASVKKYKKLRRRAV